MCARRHGLSLLEVIIACAVGMMLMLAIFNIYRTGLAAWMKGDAHTELRQQLQISIQKINREIERSTYDSLSVSANTYGMSLLCAANTYGDFVFDPTIQKPRWQKYLVFYYRRDPGRDTGSLRVVQIPVLGTPEETTPAPRPLTDADVAALTGGDVLARNLYDVNFSITSPEHLVRLRLVGQKDRYGAQAPEQLEVISVYGFRN